MQPQLITDLGQNRLQIILEGKTILIRCRTVYQMEQYRKWVEARMAEDKAKADQPPADPAAPVAPEDPLGQMQENLERFEDWAEIALNPTPDKHEWTKDRIRAALDADQIELLALVWLDRFMVPRKDADPSLMAPRSR
jgi:hypothetical protein